MWTFATNLQRFKFIYLLSVEFPVAVVDVSRFATSEYLFLFRKYFCHAF